MKRNPVLFASGVLGAALALGACEADEETEPGTDTGTDTADTADTMEDTGTDTVEDMGHDMGHDTGTDTMVDTGTDTMVDTGNDTAPDPCEDAPATVVVDGDITADTWWCAASDIQLQELSFVTNGATLHIEAGAVIKGSDGAALVVAKDGMIDAQGTATSPIVFTSSFGDDAEPGDWGGLVLLGSATINVGSSNIEGMEASAASSYGGTDDTHDCGTLRYVRVEYGGYVFGEDNELNGLTVGGCGSDTTLEYIQVHKGLDDGIEFFGGTANLRYAVVTQTGDDSLDWDEGYRGNVQFVAIQQSESAGDRGFEADNLEDDNDASPRSNPTIYNVTMVSAGDNTSQRGMTIRRGTAATIGNVVMVGFDSEPVDVEGSVTAGFWGDEFTISYLLDFDNAGWKDETAGGDNDDDGGFDEATAITGATGYSTADPELGDWENLTAPNLVPSTTGGAVNGGETPGGWFEAASYYGAFEPGATSTWMAGWTAFP